MRRGVSPIVASLLLVLIAAAASIAVYLLVHRFRPSPSGSFALLKAEAVGYEGQPVLYVRNIGEAKEVVSTVYVYDSRGRLVWYADNLGLAVEPGGLVEVPLDAGALKPGEKYTVVVAGASGAASPGYSFVYTPAAPGAGANGTLLIGVHPPGSGTTNPPPGSYTYPLGSQVRVSAAPGPGYRLARWLLNGTLYSTDTEAQVTVARLVNLTAVFEQIPPRFTIVDCNDAIWGPVSSGQRLTVKVNNTGPTSGEARLEVYDHNDLLVNYTQVEVAPATPRVAELTVTLPREPGRYTWTVKVRNLATGDYDDARIFTADALKPGQFTIADYNSSIAGPVSSRQRIAVTVSNTGQVAGAARVEVYDHDGNLVNSSQLSIDPNSQQTAVLTVTLPPARGTYLWTLKVKNLATDAYDDARGFTVAARDLILHSRGATIYEDFESMPSGWTQIGGNWVIVSAGWRGNALRGTDNNGGPGRTSVFANNSQLPSTVKAVVKLGNVGRDSTYRGFALLNSLTTSASLYEIPIRPTPASFTLYIRSYTGRWNTLASQSASYYGAWYTLYLEFSRGATNSITAYLYDSSGNQLASVSATDSRIAPAYIGLIVDGSGPTMFDDLVVTPGADPRYVTVTGLQEGWVAQLLDSSGSVVAQAAADAAGTARLWVLNCSILRNATIMILDQGGRLVIQGAFPMVVGGDEYAYG